MWIIFVSAQIFKKFIGILFAVDVFDLGLRRILVPIYFTLRRKPSNLVLLSHCSILSAFYQQNTYDDSQISHKFAPINFVLPTLILNTPSWTSSSQYHDANILYHKIQSVCDCMYMWNRLPNHARYGDEPFTGDSVGLGLGQRLNFIFKKDTLGAKSPLM